MEDVKINVKLKLSALWTAMMLLYIYADILSLFRPGQVEEMMEGLMGPFPVTQTALITASILMAIPSVMIFLSLVLKSNLNRWVNIILGAIYTVIILITMWDWAFYIFYGVIEVVLTALIVWYAWRWPGQETT